MKNIIQNSVLPFALFAGALALFGCDQVAAPESHSKTTESETTVATSAQSQEQAVELKSGNMFYIIRDVADFQLKAGDYVEQLKQTQTELQTAVNAQDTAQLQQTATALESQLKGFNEALTGLNLKSQEIDQVRSKIMTANEQVLASPFLNGDVDLSKVDFKQIEQQMGNVQSEMIKLAGMLLENGGNTAKESSDNSEKS